MSRLARLILACLVGALVAGGVATLYVGLRPGALGGWPAPEVLTATGVGVLLTLAHLFVRFGRWQFVLRRLGQRIPAVESLAAFVGSFAFLPVPLLMGQLAARRRLLPEAMRTSAPANVLAFVWERLLDVWALSVLSLLLLPTIVGWLGLAIVLVGLAPGVRRLVLSWGIGAVAQVWNLLVPERLEFADDDVGRVLEGRLLAPAAGASLLAWGLVAAGLPLLAAAGGGGFDVRLAGVAAAGVLVGGLSLLPMGVAVSGLVMLTFLGASGVPDPNALEWVFLHRLATVWFSFALGWMAVLLGWRHLRRQQDAHTHFDAIEDCYDTWMPPHYRDYMVSKKVQQMAPHLSGLGATPRGLDIGCGRGWYLRGVRDTGAQVVGVDLSRAQLEAAASYTEGSARLAQASINDLPFREGAFSFAYTINVVHHLPSPEHQRAAFAEMARVLEPGGLLFLHEMNVRNPVFRGYLGYVFPILKGIDEGVEHFLDPRELPLPDELEVAEVGYFTFVPDLCPAPLLPFFVALERRLEKSPLAPMGVHFLAVLRRKGS